MEVLFGLFVIFAGTALIILGCAVFLVMGWCAIVLVGTLLAIMFGEENDHGSDTSN